ncbi:MAG: peptidoglycan bridge formation glycyltransferase FemA/FemB family protein [bacterium]|nr:peptidoglycan bridge formation glycyltransferase FemA/FemB family protein [bacterium]
MFEIREISASGGKTEYDPLLISKQTPFTQAWFYGEWQEMMGRKVRRFEVKKDSEIIGFFQIIKYPLPFGQSLLYIPHGPVLRIHQVGGGGETDDIFLKEFRDKLFEIAKEENAILARFDFYPALTANLSEYFHKIPSYAYYSVYFQPKYEWVLNIDKPENELFSSMHPKNRYNIRLAENKGVAIEIIENNFEKYFEMFFSLLSETAKRDNFNLHPKAYYQNVFTTLEKNNAFLVVAIYGEKIILINLILLFGGTAYFLFGGSSGEYKNLMSSHLAQWETIKEAKKRGFAVYNFGGVDGGEQKNLGGVSFFKKRFGGQLLEYSDSYDLVIKSFWYRLYNLRKRYWR